MNIRVLFFGATADLVGKREVNTSVSDAASPRDVLQELVADHPGLGLHSLLFAVNQEYARLDTVLTEGDELAIFTPVSGG